MVSNVMLMVIMLSVVMLSDVTEYCSAECQYSKCIYGECLGKWLLHASIYVRTFIYGFDLGIYYDMLNVIMSSVIMVSVLAPDYCMPQAMDVNLFMDLTLAVI